jgi:hypothetical protein
MRGLLNQGGNSRPCKMVIHVVKCSHGLPRRKGVRALLRLGDFHRLGGTLVPPPREGSPGAPTPFSVPVFDSGLLPADEMPWASYLIQ